MKGYFCDYCERMRPRKYLKIYHTRDINWSVFTCNDFKLCLAAWEKKIAQNARKNIGRINNPDWLRRMDIEDLNRIRPARKMAHPKYSLNITDYEF